MGQGDRNTQGTARLDNKRNRVSLVLRHGTPTGWSHRDGCAVPAADGRSSVLTRQQRVLASGPPSIRPQPHLPIPRTSHQPRNQSERHQGQTPIPRPRPRSARTARPQHHRRYRPRPHPQDLPLLLIRSHGLQVHACRFSLMKGCGGRRNCRLPTPLPHPPGVDEFGPSLGTFTRAVVASTGSSNHSQTARHSCTTSASSVIPGLSACAWP